MRRKRRLAAGLVVVTAGVVASTTACATRTRKSTPASSPSGEKPPPIDFRHVKDLNPRIDTSKIVYVDDDGTHCYVVVPEEGPHQGGWQPPKQKRVDCPPEMDDPAWDACKGGVLDKDTTDGTCFCVRDGNPPPPVRFTPCPR